MVKVLCLFQPNMDVPPSEDTLEVLQVVRLIRVENSN